MWSSGRVVVMGSGFGYVLSVVQLKEKRLFSSTLIKKKAMKLWIIWQEKISVQYKFKMVNTKVEKAQVLFHWLHLRTVFILHSPTTI